MSKTLSQLLPKTVLMSLIKSLKYKSREMKVCFIKNYDLEQKYKIVTINTC